MPGIASAATAVALAFVGSQTSTHPHRRRRDHASQPRAADHRRAVRNARVALSGPHRPRPRPRAGNRPGRGLRAAPQPGSDADQFPRRCRRADELFQRDERPRPRHPRRRAQHPDLDPRLEPVRRPARGHARPALRLRLALRAADDDGSDPRLSRALRAVGAARQALCDARLQRLSRPTRDEEAQLLATSVQQAFVALRTGHPITAAAAASRLCRRACRCSARDRSTISSPARRSAARKRCGARSSRRSSSAPAPTS